MSKLAGKFLFGISTILVAVILLSLYLNSNFIERYYLYQEKKDMNRICNELSASGQDLDQAISRLEASEDVVIAWVKSSEDNNLLNQRLREAFLNKGLGLEKYWLWDQDQQDVIADGRKMRIYQQEKLHYSLLVEYLNVDGNFLAAAKIIPSVGRTIALINQVTMAVFLCAAIIMIILIYILVRRITTPLKAIGETARSIAMLDFRTLDIRTGDELEELAHDINDMSDKLQNAQRQMEELLANVSHDLKTPVSLIKAYASGIQDGMDDGTFLDTIIRQNESMEQMIERLLNLAKIRQQEIVTEPVAVSDLLNNLISNYQIQAGQSGHRFQCRIDDRVMIRSGKEAVETIFSNLLSNAVKYSAGEVIEVELRRQTGGCLFQIVNQVNESLEIETDRLWDPFYVAEPSRNRGMSGTGLGLSIVSAVAQRYGMDCRCQVKDGKIRFLVQFKENTD